MYESSLMLSHWNPAPFAVSLAHLQAHGVRLSNLAREAEGEERLRRLYDVVMPVHHDIPGWEDRPQPSFELWSSWVKANPHWNPEVAEIITENHSLNGSMLAVNRKLGYVSHPGTFHLCRKLG